MWIISKFIFDNHPSLQQKETQNQGSTFFSSNFLPAPAQQISRTKNNTVPKVRRTPLPCFVDPAPFLPQ